MEESTKKVEGHQNTGGHSERKPNEQVGFHFSSSLKITDPNTGEVLIKIRAD